jgi:hypothetical protein
MESHASMVKAPAIVFFVLTPIVVGTRFWSRIQFKAAIGPDDWIILASFVSHP